MTEVTVDLKVEILVALIAAKMTWLESFSSGRSKRPDHEILTKRREMTVLKAILRDYQP